MTTTQHHHPGPVRAFVARRPLSTFIGLVLAAGWPILSIPVLAGGLPAEPFALATTLLVLLPAALWITSVGEGRDAARALLHRALRWRFGIGWWAAILLGLPAFTVAIGLLLGGTLHPVDVGAFLFQIVTSLLIINLAEELAWAGFLQTRLARRHGLFLAGVLTAVPFALLHAPLLLLAGGPFELQLGIVLMFGLVLRPLLGVTMAATGGSVLAAAALHAVFNQLNGLSGSDPRPAVLLAMITLTGVLTVAWLRRADR